ncbi:biotin-independent malonate decarboxylase subunit beta [Undibacterium crateris]|uniref:biotin-independent malonate decarboxylase subunit beta n=1 Tax=Undibacterium crateris TaxID=2528175 RepID=UPI00138A2852|nr:biotin-independent malonate decarboxylase subunit beta [Undibacterium crateris]NDI87357.1 biotin-independent malonate decarboxylase subunit beta [Undibacterium crateris]
MTSCPYNPALNFANASPRERLAGLVDAFCEILPPSELQHSPQLQALGLPVAADDGVVIGSGYLNGQLLYLAAQDGRFMGGSVGEIHGAKLLGLCRLALQDRPAALVLLGDSGGVRLQEANAGLLAIAELLRAVLEVRAAGIPVLMLIGGQRGCFGGMGLVAYSANAIVMSANARLGMSGPEVIASACGRAEYDPADQAQIMATTGAQHRWEQGDIVQLVSADIASFRAVLPELIQAYSSAPSLSLSSCRDEHQLLQRRLQAALLSDQLPATPYTAQTLHDDPLLQVLLNVSASDWQLQGDAQLVHGELSIMAKRWTLIALRRHAAIGVELAWQMAALVMQAVQQQPQRPLLLLIDTAGQRLRRQEEMLGLPRFMAHLAKSLQLARMADMPVLALIYDQALSGAIVATGMMADQCYALEDAQIHVMAASAVASITGMSEDKVRTLNKRDPGFAPGVAHYWAMGGIDAIWSQPTSELLLAALAKCAGPDRRSSLGQQRGGRRLAQNIADAVLSSAKRNQ